MVQIDLIKSICFISNLK